MKDDNVREGSLVARRLAVAACLTLVAASCAAPTDDAERPDRIRAIVLPYLTHMPFHVAEAEGYFAEQNLEVEFIRLGRVQEIMTALANGDVDVASGMLSVNELSLIAAGARLRAVASLNELTRGGCTFSAFIARRALADSGALADPERLRGMRIDVDPLLPIGYFTDELLRPFGLTIDDLEITNVPTPTAIECVRTGTIEITLDTEPFVSRYASMDEAVVWRRLSDLVPGYVTSVVMFGPTLIDERPDVGQRFMTATLKAIRQLRDGKTPRNLALVEAASGLTAEQVSEACWPSPPDDGRIDGGRFLPFQQWALARGVVNRVLSTEELVDHRFIDFANAELAR